MVYAFARGGVLGVAALAAGAALLGRSALNRPLAARSLPEREKEPAAAA